MYSLSEFEQSFFFLWLVCPLLLCQGDESVACGGMELQLYRVYRLWACRYIYIYIYLGLPENYICIKNTHSKPDFKACIALVTSPTEIQ